MIDEVLGLLRDRKLEAAAAACDEDRNFMDPRSDVVIELVRVAPILPPPVLKMLVRAIEGGAIGAARRPLSRYQRKHPGEANDVARYLERQAPTIYAEVGAWLQSAELVSERDRKWLVVNACVILLGLLWGLAFEDGEEDDEPPPPHGEITLPHDPKICVGEKNGIKSLTRCADAGAVPD